MSVLISSGTPCLILFLIDQSGSMADRFGHNHSESKSKILAQGINNTIEEIGLRCLSGAEIKNRFEIGVIGYGNESVYSGFQNSLQGKWVVSIKDIFDHAKTDSAGKPVWIYPKAEGGTPMAEAFNNAKLLCNDWINWGNHKDCHPPIIINITDGEATDAGTNDILLKNAINDVKKLHTDHGNLVLLNIHISGISNSDKLVFPDEEMMTNSKLYNDKYAKMLFESSSYMTPNMVEVASSKGYRVDNNSKGYIFNADSTDLLNFLNIGSVPVK
jgi:hypothetical protein